MTSLDRHAARLSAEIDRMQWKLSRLRRPGVVAEYDPQKHMARARLTTASGQGGMTPWCRINESAGANTSRTTLTVGQTVWVDCPNGDLRQASISAGHHSDNYPSPSQAGDETRLARGDGFLSLVEGQASLEHGGGVVRAAAGNVYINC